MKYSIFKMMMMAMVSTSAFAQGGSGHVGGGGDPHEERVNDIRSDLLKWINEGGAKALNLYGLDYRTYESKMVSVLQLKRVVVSFTSQIVSVAGLEKTCRGDVFANDEMNLLCNIDRFEKTSEAQQYSLIHHEYAGLVGIEKNEGAASDYEISKQITGYLENQQVLKLRVKSAMPPINLACTVAFQNDELANKIEKKGYQSVRSNPAIQIIFYYSQTGNGRNKERTLDGGAMLHVESGYRRLVAGLNSWAGPGTALDPKRKVYADRLKSAESVMEYDRIKREMEQETFQDKTRLDQFVELMPTCEEFYNGAK